MTEQNFWSGGDSEIANDIMKRFSASIKFDWRLYDQDIRGSIAHARMLCTCGVLNDEEFEKIEKGLIQIRDEIKNKKFDWSQSYEDIHMNIESDLISKIGDVGKKLHTGRSRNDQIATDMRLYLREQLDKVCVLLTNLQIILVELAEEGSNSVIPGYTHMQTAQPVTLGHHILAWNEMFQRDYERLQDCRKRINICPLGSAALAGTGHPIDRHMTAKELGFNRISCNSLDAVSDRDFMIEFQSVSAILMVHFSRISEELILWSSDTFGFIDIGDEFCTGSSIMPQKKNPDVPELIRGKCGRVCGNLIALLMVMKSQPLSYNRDNQEDKEPLFDTINTISICLKVLGVMMPGIKFDQKVMLDAASRGFSTSTDLADYLVRRNVPFRDAHHMVKKIIRYTIKTNQRIEEMKLTEFKKFSNKIDLDVYDVLTVEHSVNVRCHIGGTAPEQVRNEVKRYKEILAERDHQEKRVT